MGSGRFVSCVPVNSQSDLSYPTSPTAGDPSAALRTGYGGTRWLRSYCELVMRSQTRRRW